VNTACTVTESSSTASGQDAGAAPTSAAPAASKDDGGCSVRVGETSQSSALPLLALGALALLRRRRS
jgi:MYXO-CTERM domain-containing protein